ncbi:hypothetical protein SLS56_004500 [Neofusicoccum ribis]|uniref:Uncharacterized protein n=1 Tax=Neofusicoccum ribis TaxID=45134 RepID=A0ABR3SWT9_9PEZI
MRLNNFSLLVLLSFIVSVFGQLPSLGIKQDQAAKSQSRFLWSSVATYDSPTYDLFTGDELYGLARQAWQEMAADWEVHKSVRGNRPGMMGALTVGNSVYFSSSAKGDNFMYNYVAPDEQPLEVQAALKRCETSMASLTGDDGKPHRTMASCAEIMALHQFYQDPDVDAATKANPGKMRVVAFGQGRKNKEGRPFPPCGDENAWGCDQFTKNQGIEVPPIPSTVPDKDPAVTPVSTKQVIICAGGAPA